MRKYEIVDKKGRRLVASNGIHKFHVRQNDDNSYERDMPKQSGLTIVRSHSLDYLAIGANKKAIKQ